MNALRFVICAGPSCGQHFFLCSHCDRGHRYCGAACSETARRRSLREAGTRYQATTDGRHAHARRQARYRERQKVTHHPDEAEPVPVTVPLAPTNAVIETADSSGASEKTHAKDERTYRCAWCERESRFLRHETLAKYRPRWRRPP